MITSGSITYNIDKLEKKGLLRRVPAKEDRRVIYAEMTADGRKLFDRIFPLHAARIHELMSGVSAEQKRQMSAWLKQLGLAAEQR